MPYETPYGVYDTGETSLAQNGGPYLDELGEFPRSA